MFRNLFADPPPLLTSSLVIAEGHTWFLRRYGQTRALQFLDFVRQLALAVSRFDEIELAKAERLMKRFDDQQLTFPDAHGLAIMAERRIQTCWSTDPHLALTGIPLIITAV